MRSSGTCASQSHRDQSATGTGSEDASDQLHLIEQARLHPPAVAFILYRAPRTLAWASFCGVWPSVSPFEQQLRNWQDTFITLRFSAHTKAVKSMLRDCRLQERVPLTLGCK